jgi:hypothetical protein
LEVLESKHPHARIPDANSLPNYSQTPNYVDVGITEECVKKVAQCLSSSAGLGGTDSHALQQWLLRFRTASRELHTALAELTEWLSNSFPPWAAYQALMAGHLVALDKCPGVRPLGIGETWWRTLTKTLLLAAGSKAKEACGIDQLCACLKADIRGGIHAMQNLWDLHRQEEEWGFLLIDANNAFNEQNRMSMLYTVQHEWLSGARFVFN